MTSEDHTARVPRYLWGAWCTLRGHDWKINEIPGQYAPEYFGECRRCGKYRHTLTKYALGGNNERYQ